MTLMQRRRAIMAQKTGGNDVLWHLENYPFNFEYIDTGIQLFLTDIPWTIAVDLTMDSMPSSGDGNIPTIVYSTSNNNYLRFGRYTGTSLLFVYLNTTATHNNVWGTGRIKLVIARTAGGNPTAFYRRNDGNKLTLGPIEKTFSASPTTISLGFTGARCLPTGTIHSAAIYNRALSDAEINDFLGVS